MGGKPNIITLSKYTLGQYLQNAKQDIYEAKQFRYGIESTDNQLVGCIDLYDFDPKNRRACVGIAILKPFQKQGFGKTALQILIKYASIYLDLHQLVAYVPENNQPSKRLFEKAGFISFGIKKDWIFSQGQFQDVIIFQKIF